LTLTHALLPWLCSVAAVGYVLTASAVLVSRAGYERRRRIATRLEREVLETPARDTRRSLQRRRLGLLLRIAAEASLSKDSERALARTLVARMGAPDFRRTAAGERHNRRQVAALRALAAAGQDEPWDCFADALWFGTPDVRAAVVAMLGRIPDRRAAVLLVEALRSGRHPRSRVATAIDAFPIPIGDLLVPLLTSADPYDRYWGAMLMRRYPDARGLQRMLTVLARDREAMVRRAAIETIGAAGYQGAADLVATLTGDPIPYVRAHAARALGRLRAADQAGVLLPLMADREWIVRAAAKQSLESMGPIVAGLVSDLLADADRFARDGASEVLQNLGAGALPLAALDDRPSNVVRFVQTT
jgi:HEAT repeat protein